VVSASDDQGRQSYSDPVIVFAADPAGGGSSTYRSLPGDTLAGISDRLGVPPVLLAAGNPGLDPSATLPDGSAVSVPLPASPGPVSFAPLPAPPSGGSPAGSAPGKLQVWLSLRTGGDSVPPAPILSAAASGCNVTLAITPSAGGSKGLFLYRLDGSGTSFQRIATLGPGVLGSPILYTDAGVYGPLLYYAASFNGAGESAGNLAGLTISAPECKPSTPPAYELTRLMLTPAKPLDNLYCYFSLTDGQWSRVPAGDGNFIYPLDGTFDLTPFIGLVPTAGITPQTQCWGWRGGSLEELGPASGSPPTADGSFALSAADYGISGRLSALDLVGGGIHLMDGPASAGPIMPPQILDRTTNLETCTAHFPGGASGFLGPLLCGPAITNNNLILVWDWVPTCIFTVEGSKYKCSDYISDVSGFHIYASAPGKTPVLVATVHNKDQHVYFFDGGRFGPKTRFFVRAYVALFESPNSNTYTLADVSPGTLSVTLLPTLLHTSQTFAFDETCSGTSYPTLGSHAVWTDGLNVVVGQDYEYPPDSCINWYDYHLYGRVSFDLTSIAGPVASATLNFTQGYSVANQYMIPVTCLDQLGMVTAISGGDMSAWDPYRSLPFAESPSKTYAVDATDLVRAWQLGSENMGFVLSPKIDATDGDPSTQQCWSTLSDFHLKVTYFK
jgi:hypothetical protein